MPDVELETILDELPATKGIERPPGAPNAWVYVDGFGRLAILLKEGGWLGLEPKRFEHLQADIAPFSD